jgi:hypothetical protein
MNIAPPQGPFCQSCAMPMQKSEDFGTNTDGGKSKEYCHYCFQSGKFIEPNITMEQMIEKCSGVMKQMNIPDKQITQTKKFIPILKRWKDK